MALLNIAAAIVLLFWASGADQPPTWLPTAAYVIVSAYLFEGAIQKIRRWGK